MREGWKAVQIEDVAKVANGGTPKTKVPEYWGGEHVWITPAEMGRLESPYLASSRRKLSDSGLQHSSATLVPSHSVILSTRAPIGHLIINSVPMAFNQGCRGIVPGENVHHKYLYYFLRFSEDLLNDLGSGTTFKELSAGKLKKVEIPLPPLPEQKGIVAILDEAFAGIDTAIANTQKNLVNAREVFKSYLDSVFSQQFMEMAERNLAEVCVNLDSKRVPITRSNRVPGDVPYYGATGIVDHVEDYIFDEDLLLVSEDGANLLARSYPIAFSVSGKTWVNNHAHVLRFERIESQRFVEYYLNSVSLEKYVSGMAQPKLNQRALNSIKIPFPSIEEQRVVVSKLDELADGNGQLSEVYEKKLIALAELKQSLLQKAFSGELTADAVDAEDRVEAALA
jgi:type I restriction enzyme S subunit